MNKKRFYIHCADDTNKQLFDTESDFNIHIEGISSDEELIRLCNLLNKQQAKIEELKTYNLQHFLEWLVINEYITDEPLKDINNVMNELYEENKKLKRENEALRSNVELFAHQLVDHTLYSDDFLEILKIIEGEETIEKIRERQNEIIKILGGKYE